MLNKVSTRLVTRLLIFVLTLVLSACSATGPGKSSDWYSLENYQSDNPQCFDRSTMPYTFVVDSHNHFRPFGGNAIPFTELNDYFNKLGILFVNIYGIGQVLPIESGCEYYLDCPHKPVYPSIRNDFRNASNFLEYEPQGVYMTLSMSFPDLSKPELIVPQIKLMDKEYPKMFTWMGEVNLVKQALFNNSHRPTPIEAIAQWKDAMKILQERRIPIAIHADLGSDNEPTKYLHLMEEVLKLYPDNKIVWVHMGLSKELTNMDPVRHLKIMQDALDANPHLMLDISWRVIEDSYFSNPEIRAHYVDFFNKNSTRILPGTDFVASRKKDFDVYREEVEATSRIHQYINDEAFRHIALGQNYIDFLGLVQYKAPPVCQ